MYIIAGRVIRLPSLLRSPWAEEVFPSRRFSSEEEAREWAEAHGVWLGKIEDSTMVMESSVIEEIV